MRERPRWCFVVLVIINKSNETNKPLEKNYSKYRQCLRKEAASKAAGIEVGRINMHFEINISF